MADLLTDKEINDLLEAVSKEEYRDKKDYSVLEGMERDSVSKIRTAFDKGYKQGYEIGVASQGFVDGYTEEEVEKREKEAYQKGLNEAWKAARNIIMGACIDEIFTNAITYTNVFCNYTASEAIAKLDEYEQKQNEIKVGDEVIAINGNSKPYVVTDVKENHVYGFDDTGVLRGLSHYETKFKKTGRHFDQIEEVLEALKEG